MDIINVSERVSKIGAAEALNIQNCDFALPQGWVDEIVSILQACSDIKPEHKEDIYARVVSSFVWSYDKSLFGFPQPLTICAFGWLKIYDRVKRTFFAQDTLKVLNIV